MSFTWSEALVNSFAANRAVAYSGSVFCAVGQDAVSWTSPDAATWTMRDTATLDYALWDTIEYANGKFVAIASDAAKCATSTDGITWTMGTMPNIGWFSLAWNGTRWVAFARYYIAYSTDGLNWTLATLPANVSQLRPLSLIWDGTRYVGLSYYCDYLCTSTDGITWSDTSINLSTLTYKACRIAYSGSMYVVSDEDYESDCASSPDGITWTSRSLPLSKVWRTLKYANGQFVMTGGSTNVFLTSSDGITWTQSTFPRSGDWYGATVAGTNVLILSLSYAELGTGSITPVTQEGEITGGVLSSFSTPVGRAVIAGSITGAVFSVIPPLAGSRPIRTEVSWPAPSAVVGAMTAKAIARGGITGAAMSSFGAILGEARVVGLIAGSGLATFSVPSCAPGAVVGEIAGQELGRVGWLRRTTGNERSNVVFVSTRKDELLVSCHV